MSFFAHLQTSWTILRIALEERLVYRGDFALGTLMRFLPIVTQIFLWWAVFESIAAAVPGTTEPATIRGYSYHDFVAYYLLTMVGRAFSSMPGLASGIGQMIRSGEIKKFLVQPLDLIHFLFLQRVAHKLAYYSVALGPFALVFFLCQGFFSSLPDWEGGAAFVVSLLLGFALGFYLETAIGLLSFWFLEVSSFLFVFMLFSFFLSGHMFPLDMLPEPWDKVVNAMPFRYLAYFPAAVFLRKVRGSELLGGLLIEVAWLFVLSVGCRILFSLGTRRYTGYGG